MERSPLGDGVVVYRGVPIVDSPEQHGYAYLHVRGSPRDAPSYQMRAYLGDAEVTATVGRSHPAFAGEATTYNSPPPRGGTEVSAGPDKPGAEQAGSYDVMIDVSDALRAGAPSDRADVTLVLTDLRGRPLDVSQYDFDDLFITRHR